MSRAPFYRRGEVVYLRSSAEIGQLDSFKISNAKQIAANQWVYKIDIGKRPPKHQMTGDRYDGRIPEKSILFTEGELITLCEALNIIVARLTTQLENVNAYLDSECMDPTEEEPVEDPDGPKFNVGDTIYFTSSARIGFLEEEKVKEIWEIGVQPGSQKTRYEYKINNKPQNIVFREDELITKCEAAVLIKSYVENRLLEMQNKQSSLCI